MYKISLVPTNEVTKIWNKVESLVDKVIPYTYGRMLTVDVLHSLIINHYHLWIIYKDDKDKWDGEVEAIAITEFMKYPRKTVLLINFISGDKLDDWVKELDKVLVKFSKESGCDFLEACGRSGWERKVKKIGWQKKFTIVERHHG
tara:strand:+ start:894 stop:1328 length:435 start_codon:yes stop_codon:yes gene_type:complete